MKGLRILRFPSENDCLIYLVDSKKFWKNLDTVDVVTKKDFDKLSLTILEKLAKMKDL